MALSKQVGPRRVTVRPRGTARNTSRRAGYATSVALSLEASPGASNRRGNR
jgi:hypothetical protein